MKFEGARAALQVTSSSSIHYRQLDFNQRDPKRRTMSYLARYRVRWIPHTGYPGACASGLSVAHS